MRAGALARAPVAGTRAAAANGAARPAARRPNLSVRAASTVVPVKTTGTKDKVKIGINGEWVYDEGGGGGPAVLQGPAGGGGDGERERA